MIKYLKTYKQRFRNWRFPNDSMFQRVCSKTKNGRHSNENWNPHVVLHPDLGDSCFRGNDENVFEDTLSYTQFLVVHF